jgi:diguanylate cyclase (GGDEF)-like protein
MNLLPLTAWIDLSSLQVPWPITLGCACVCSYLVGRITLKPSAPTEEDNDGVCRMSSIPKDLQQMANNFQQELSAHNLSIDKLKEIVRELKEVASEDLREDLTREAEETLKTTCRLATQLSCTNEEVSRRVSKIKSSTVLVNDPVTGLQTREALEESLTRMFAMQSRYELPFSVVSFGLAVDVQESDDEGDAAPINMQARAAAEILSGSARESDVIGRHDGDTFVVLLPNTTMEAAIQYCQRALASAQDALADRVYAGVATAGLADDPASLLKRSVETMRAAKGTMVNCICYHDGEAVQPANEQVEELTASDLGHSLPANASSDVP